MAPRFLIPTASPPPDRPRGPSGPAASTPRHPPRAGRSRRSRASGAPRLPPTRSPTWTGHRRQVQGCVDHSVGAGTVGVDPRVLHDAYDLDGRPGSRNLDDRRFVPGVAFREPELAPYRVSLSTMGTRRVGLLTWRMASSSIRMYSPNPCRIVSPLGDSGRKAPGGLAICVACISGGT